jgi:hypothetical protein
MQQNKYFNEIVPVPMSLFPTMNSLQEVMDMGASRMPINQWNEMHAILMVYHNTMLKVIKEQPCK